MRCYTVLPILEKLGLDAEVESCEITESRLYIKVVNKKVQAEVTPGDMYRPELSLRIQRSDWGPLQLSRLYTAWYAGMGWSSMTLYPGRIIKAPE